MGTELGGLKWGHRSLELAINGSTNLSAQILPFCFVVLAPFSLLLMKSHNFLLLSQSGIHIFRIRI